MLSAGGADARPNPTAQEVADKAAPNDVSAETPEEQEFSVDASTSTETWRAELNEDHSVRVIFGPGSSKVDLGAKAARVLVSDASAIPANGMRGKPVRLNSRPLATTRSAAALSWYCVVNSGWSTDVYQGNNLRTYYSVDCVGVDYHRVDWQFQRSSWSGYRSYTNWQQGGNVSAVNNSSYIYAYCSGGGRTYDYRGAVQSSPVVGGQRSFGPIYVTYKVRTTCGTGVS